MDKKRLLRAAAIFFSCMTIYVREGERVKKGDLLFEVDPLLLEEKILYQRQEMEKQRLQVQDAKSQKDVSAQQKANEQAQASEQYSLTTRSAAVQLSRAKENLEEAKKKLKEFQSSGSVVQEESMVESSLEKALEEKEAAVISGRAVYSAGIPDPSNSSDRMNEITYEQMELSLQKLEKLKEEYRRR